MSNWDPSSLSLPQLAPLNSVEELDAHLAAIEYALANPITIRDEADIRSHKHWSEHLTPYEHQVKNLITFCRRAPVALIADDVGLGKTISAGLIVSELMARKKVRRVLVLCPKLLLPQWCEELTSKFGIKAYYAVGDEVLRLANTQIQAVVTTYDSARERLEEISKYGFEMIVIDEAHKLRNLYGQNQPPKLAVAIKRALAQNYFKYALLLTATPIQNRLWDIYSLIDRLAAARGHENPLGNPAQFAQRYLEDGKTVAKTIFPGRVEEFRRRISEYMVRTSRRDSNLIFPARRITLRSCSKTDVDHELEALVEKALKGASALARISIAQAHMSSPAALAEQLKNMAENGSVPRDLAEKVNAIASRAPTGSKVQVLLSLAKGLMQSSPGQWRMVVFTQRKATQDRIGEALQKSGVEVGFIRGGAGMANQRTIKGFWADPPEFNVIVSTDSGAEGINLQVCNVLVNFDLPWNPMILEQRIGRVQRLASKHSTVEVVNLVVAGSVEENVLARLIQKLAAISTTIGDLEAILEASPDGSLESIEDSLKDLVVRALMGQDVEKATEKIRKSIEAAKQIYEAEKQTVEKNLGALDSMHTAGPSQPELSTTKPRLSPFDFIAKSFLLEGAAVNELSDHRLHILLPGRPPFTAVFDERDPNLLDAGLGTFGGKTAELFTEGAPAFERQVGAWGRRHGHHIVDSLGFAPETVESLAKEWVAESISDGTFVAHEAGEVKADFHGTLSVRASASVAHDRFEKLITVTVGKPMESGFASIPNASEGINTIRRHANAGELIPDSRQRIPAAVAQDPDISAFCKFYDARRVEEVARAGLQEGLMALAARKFEPSLSAEVVGALGRMQSAVDTRISFRIGGSPTYHVNVSIIPGSRIFIAEPERAVCAITSSPYPLLCLEECAITGKNGLRHKMAFSEESKRYALPEFGAICGESGRHLLKDETQASAVSGLLVDQSLLGACVITKKLALAREMAFSEKSKRYALPEFGVVCGESGRQLLKDETQASAVSGMLVDQSLLVACVITKKLALAREMAFSEKSKRYALPEFGVVCGESGRQLLKDETQESTVSGLRVDHSLLVMCAITKKRALARELVQCAFTGQRVLPEFSSLSEVSGKPFLKSEALSSAVSGKVGHKSELMSCTLTGDMVFPAETERSSVSGRVARLDLLIRSEKPPGRLGCPDEAVACQVSACQLLRDEVETSAHSGVVADRELFGRSEESGKPALRTELVACAVLGRRLLPSEVDTCDATKKVVSRRLLGRSQVSGRQVIASLLQKCEESGQLGLEEELVECSMTKMRVVPEVTVASSVSGRRVLGRLAVHCAECGGAMLPEEAAHSSDGSPAHSEHLSICAWTGKIVVKGRIKICHVTGVSLAEDVLGQSGLARPMEKLIVGHAQQQPSAGAEVTLLQAALQKRGIVATKIWILKSTDTGLIAALSEWREMLGLRRHNALCFIEPHGKLIGRVAKGQVNGGKWIRS